MSNISEIRRFLLKFAARRNIRVQEYKSGPNAWYVHLQAPDGDSSNWKTATSVSQESADSALTMAFLSLSNREMDFLD